MHQNIYTSGVSKSPTCLPDDGTYDMLKHVGDLLTSNIYIYFGACKSGYIN